MIQHGPGSLADPDAPAERWGGRKAQQYVALTLATYGRVCWLCGLPGANSADHVIPRNPKTGPRGAVYDIQNLAPSHRRCNEARGNRDRVGPVIPIENGLAYFEGAA